MRQLHRDLGIAVGMHEIRHTLPGWHMLRPVHAGAMQADAALRQHIGHLGDDQAGAPDGAATEMNKVPVAHGAVRGRVLAHRRDHHPVAQR